MENVPNIISKDPDTVTDAELEELKKAIDAAHNFLEIVQRAHERITEGRVN